EGGEREERKKKKRFTPQIRKKKKGTLTLSYAIKQSGTVMGLVYLLLTCFGAAYTTNVLVYCSEVCGCNSYRRLAKHLYGGGVAIAMQAALIGLLWSACVSYMTLVKTLLTSAVHIIVGEDNSGVWDDDVILLSLCVAVIVMPLALMRKVSALRYSSMAGLFILCFTCAVVIGLFFSWCNGSPCNVEDGDTYCEYHRHCFFKSIADLQFVAHDFLQVFFF
ncbi:solute carrier family 38, member 5, partial [Reticulomyxa filosa]